MINYFFVYRPFHFDYIKEVISTCFKRDDNFVINHFAANYQTTENDSIKQLENLPESLYARTMAIRRLRKKIKELAEQNKELNIFVPHNLGLLSNYSYYRLAPDFKNVKINVFYEGVIVFYNYDHDYKENFGYYVSRWVSGFFTGTFYKIDKRLLDFYDKRVHKIYTPFLNIDAPKEKLVEVKLTPVNYEPKKNTCLLIGLKLEDRFKHNTATIIRAIYKKINDIGIEQLYFKEHPSDKCDLFYDIAKEFSRELIIINDKSPIEKIIHKYCPGYIISTWSSATINLSNMIPKSTNIYCVITKNMVDTEESRRLANAYSEQGIEMIYL